MWDEEGRCLLLVGQYEKSEDAWYWIRALASMGFTVFVRWVARQGRGMSAERAMSPWSTLKASKKGTSTSKP